MSEENRGRKDGLRLGQPGLRRVPPSNAFFSFTRALPHVSVTENDLVRQFTCRRLA